MQHQQCQVPCQRCCKFTLHARTVSEVPHLLYLLLSLTCCFVGLPLWILHTIISALGGDPPFLCQVCGQSAGVPTPEQAAAAHAAMLQEEVIRQHQAKIDGIERSARVREYASRAFTSLAGGVKQLPTQTNRVLLAMAGGPENMIVFRFLQVLTLALFVGLAALLLASAWWMLASALNA